MREALKPNESHDSVFTIDLAGLYERGYKNILIDVDNTITPWNADRVSERLRGWLKQCQILGFTVCLFSNGTSSRVNRLAAELMISAVPKGGKPLRAAFKRALGYIDGRPQNTIMIGDQIFTDIWGGNLTGLYTILVNPISTREFWGTKFNRFLERVLAKRGELG
ncbi:MAG TPA: YqeG family HAD IIIA-type phosphatase [Clostridia bacterium]|nr:YqeG family HAD IIIA-type phosphatase [Clostridia bacterium]